MVEIVDLVERFNRTIENFLKTAVNEKQTNWETCIPPFLLVCRSAVHESTRKTPVSVVFGAEPRLSIGLICDQMRSTKERRRRGYYLSHLKDRLRLTHAEVRQRMTLESDRMKTRYDSRANTFGFQVGEKVWLYNPKRTKGKSPKLQKS
ncbi:hypothetical protein NQ315_015204 [Exocentrus adspersus]|uniref:Uncharacterized protein n=1 Tax=Exocentrus adspersus TaxID=1586481 RepID=A0AAV8VWD2_9CUCU|nr:hypothetical protein NQ315_015204 [Exocentrus adspersus]